MIKLRKLMSLGLACSLSLSVLAGCGAKAADEQVIIYSNPDDEAITAMSNALDANGYEGRYIFETFGTSELGGKLLAEGTNLEADLVTMSTFYLQSAQEQNGMFLPLEFDVNTLEAVPDYTAPITSQEGAIILNTEVLAEAGLDKPASLQDLADPKYAGQVAVTDIQSSSTAWLMIQALVSAYGEDGAQRCCTASMKMRATISNPPAPRRSSCAARARWLSASACAIRRSRTRRTDCRLISSTRRRATSL